MENISATLKIGMLDEQIEIQTSTTTADSYGAQVVTWIPLATEFARIENASTGNSENYDSALETTLRRITATIRYRSDVTEKMRVVYDGDTYDILVKQKIGRNRFLTLTMTIRET